MGEILALMFLFGFADRTGLGHTQRCQCWQDWGCAVVVFLILAGLTALIFGVGYWAGVTSQ